MTSLHHHSSTNKILFTIILTFILSFTSASSNNCPSDRTIPLQSIQSLTLDRDSFTASIPGKPPIPQIECIGGKCNVLPQRIQCRNVGINDMNEVQWDCTGDLPESYSFGKVEVSCIGCGQDRRGNDLVLKGSCGVMVEILAGDNSYRSPYRGGGSRHEYTNDGARDSGYDHTKASESGSGGMGVLIVILVLVFLCVLCCRPKRNSSRGATTDSSYDPRSGSSSSGHGNIYPNAPPPPPGYGGSGSSSAYDVDPPSFSRRKTQEEPSSSSSGPGFWSGLGLGSVVGGAGGYAAGRRSAQNNDTYTEYSRRPASYRSTRSSSPPTFTRTRSPSPEKKKSAHGYGGTSLR